MCSWEFAAGCDLVVLTDGHRWHFSHHLTAMTWSYLASVLFSALTSNFVSAPSWLMYLLREIFIIAGVSQRRWVEFLKIAEKGLCMPSWHLLLAQALYYSLLQIVLVPYSVHLRGQNTWKLRGFFSFTNVFHREYKAAWVWVAAKGRFVFRQLSVCLAAGLPWLKLLKLFVKLQPKSLVFLEA